MEQMMAYCGLICTECPAFIATQNDDVDALTALGVEWGNEGETFAPEDVKCDGCLISDGRIFKWCLECEIRTCASERGVVTCAHCEDYGCDKLQFVFSMGEVGAATKQRLEEIRAKL